MADTKYQVFISSTYSDLVEERRKILNILLMADCIPAGMEAFVATDNEQFDVIKKVIDLCDYYVLIIGKRYGSINPVTGISYTEMEYDYAKAKDIPVLVFAIDESIDLPDCKIEQDPEKVEALRLFRARTMSNRLVSIWKTVDELTGKLAVSIMRAKEEISRPGWQRAVDYDEASLRREIMNIVKEKEALVSENAAMKNALREFTEVTDVAFEECSIFIEYYYKVPTPNQHQTRRIDESKKVKLPVIFEIISLEMLDVMITEATISRVLKDKLLPPNHTCYLIDSQLVKKILNQLKELGLIQSSFDNSKSTLFWSLTSKGKMVRAKSTLVRRE